MKEKKSNGLLVVVAILCLLVGGVGGYFISNSFLNKNDSNQTNEGKQINEENNEQNQCKYTKLKEASTLTEEEKQEIFGFVQESVDMFVLSQMDFTIESVDDYSYWFSAYPQSGPEETVVMNVMVYKENGEWKRGDLLGSGANIEDFKPSWICNECGDCS